MTTESSSAPRRSTRWLRRVFGVALGLVVGLGIAEAVFWFRDEGAFPHVNFYRSDPELGVRLEPGATMSLGFQDNPVADISVNSQGYRGSEWAAGHGEILVVGDSQVFGLGVADDETMAAQLAELTGRPVINGGVPTYGPQEYTAVAEELLEGRDIGTLVYVVNMANDFFESDRPNRERHAVWDGWAVRAELAPETVMDFPGRRWLYGGSHSFYALRRWLNDDAPAPGGVGSEGTWQELVSTSGQSAEQREAAEAAAVRASERTRLRRAELELAAEDADEALDERLRATVVEQSPTYDALDLEVARGHPGDIVQEANVEEGRVIGVTAALIRRAVRFREQLVRDLPDPIVPTLIADRARLEEERDRLRAIPSAGDVRVPSSLEPRLREVKALCDAHGVELLVVALPLDVLVSADEWEKYDAEPVEMEPTRVLLSDLVASGEALGARGLDATDALRAAEPGAFLRGDIHMTAKGQRALAEAVAAALEAPPPLVRPAPGLPEGRTVLPSAEQWLLTPEATVRGSSAAHCETVRLHEWLRLTCLPWGRVRPTGVTWLEGGGGEALSVATEAAVDFIVPLTVGESVRADFHWTDRSQTLSVSWEGEEPQMAFGDARPAERPRREADESADRLCACHLEVTGEKECRNRNDYVEECTPACTHVFGTPTEACMREHADDCEALLRCVQGDRAMSPQCPEGQAIAGGVGHCFTLCDDARPCTEGTCSPWQGAGICRP